jgi:Glycosyltransferases involved in cell wall biogenesis
MKVSVIIPVYNVSAYIERCLLSVLDQTWQDLEIIVVDDCTPDDSMAIVRRIAQSHLRGSIIRCFAHEQNRGLSAARNTGIKNVTGEYVYFVDSDDYIPHEAIQLLSYATLEEKVDFVIGNYEVEGSDYWAPPLKMTSGTVYGPENILRQYTAGMWYVMAWNKLVNLHFLLENDLFFQEGIVHEDDLWSFKLACVSRKMAVVNAATYFYFMQPNSIMRAPSLFNLECRVRVIKYIFQYITSSKQLQNNPDVYIYYENLKAKYFDRILYNTDDKTFQLESYIQFRRNRYLRPVESQTLIKRDGLLFLRNLHYLFFERLGYHYYKFFVKLEYYSLIVSIKIKKIFA